MKKQFVIALVTVASLAACSANAISEKYRKQLEHEHKTQVQDAQGVPHHTSTQPTTYADDILDVQVGRKCSVKKVNGFTPLRVKHVKSDIDEVETRMGITLSVLKLPDGRCDITWTDKNSSRMGVLVAK